MHQIRVCNLMTDHQLSPVAARVHGPANVRISPKLLVILFGIAVLVALAAASFVIVDPTEMAGKRRLGQVVVDRPLGPGLHFKLPLIEEIDTLQTSLETYKLDKLTVNTVDNQPITLAVGLTYRIPASAVLKLLYDVGRAGNLDIAENIQRIVADRTAKIFAQQNTTTISENRERLSTALKTLLSADLSRLYGIEIVDFQIAGITYSESFRASVEAAVKAKKAVARPNGEAEAKLRIADADRQAAILNAQGKAEAIRLEGESRANVLRLNAEILRGNPFVVDLAKADRWNGALPQTLLDGTGGMPLIGLPR